MNRSEYWMICWNPGKPEVAILPWPDVGNRSLNYQCTDFDCWLHVRRMSNEARRNKALDIICKIVGDGSNYPGMCDQFFQIEELRDPAERLKAKWARQICESTASTIQ